MEMENAIATACRIKADVVEKDEREAGLRRVLNLGHTIGHALEAVTGFRRFAHGEAVGWGLVGAAFISWRRGLLKEAAYHSIAAAVDHVGPRPSVADLPARRVLEALARDKKSKGGRVPFILPAAVGRVEIHDDVSPPEIVRALRAMAVREKAGGRRTRTSDGSGE
jgi:3-dehydroquinate synthase